MSGLWVIAAEGIPASSPLAQLSVPLGLLAFLGSTYLLLRSNLGTKRAYLVLATSTFGFLMLFSLFWAYGAPGTPQATGPTNLPGQVSNELQPKWVPFAADSLLAEREDLSVVRQYPEGFTIGQVDEEGEVSFEGVGDELTSQLETGVDETQNFFSDEEAGAVVDQADVATEVGYVQSVEGDPVIGVVFEAVDEETLEPIPEGESGSASYTAFAFFDEGAPLMPAQLLAGVSLLLFILHAVLLDRDEQREKRELVSADETADEPEKVPASA